MRQSLYRTEWKTVETNCKEQQRHVHLNQHEKSAVENDSIKTFYTPSSVATRYMDRLLKEATEVWPQKTFTETTQNEHLIAPTIPPWIATNYDPRVPADI